MKNVNTRKNYLLNCLMTAVVATTAGGGGGPPVPEPASRSLLGLDVAMLIARRRR